MFRAALSRSVAGGYRIEGCGSVVRFQADEQPIRYHPAIAGQRPGIMPSASSIVGSLT